MEPRMHTMSGEDLAFRYATPADAAAVTALVNSAYRGDSSRAGWTTEADLLGGQRTDLEEIDESITAQDSAILLCLRGGGRSSARCIWRGVLRRPPISACW
jgi:hypothetical protein